MPRYPNIYTYLKSIYESELPYSKESQLIHIALSKDSELQSFLRLPSGVLDVHFITTSIVNNTTYTSTYSS